MVNCKHSEIKMSCKFPTVQFMFALYQSLWSDIMVTGSHSLLRFLSARWINTSNWHQAGIMWLLMYAVTDICNMFLLIVCTTAFLNQSRHINIIYEPIPLSYNGQT